MSTDGNTEKYWQDMAEKMRKELKRLPGSVPNQQRKYLPIDLVGISIEKLSPDSITMSQNAWLQEINGDYSWGPCETTIRGWVCFSTELDLLYYLKHVWFYELQLDYQESSEQEQQTIDLLQHSLNDSIRNGGFLTDLVRSFIFDGIGKTMGSIFLENYLHLSDWCSVCDFVNQDLDNKDDLIKEFNDLYEITAEYAFEPNNPQHIQLFQEYFKDYWEKSLE